MSIGRLLLLALSNTNADMPMIMQITELALQLDNTADSSIDLLSCVEGVGSCDWPGSPAP
jgi:hypothetical protein